ncbi:MAG: hypothetical protein E7644_03230 [Ruminococcaceae bacterium]|nr:hypothetical protein [Oscillospiraceae bacterium]
MKFKKFGTARNGASSAPTRWRPAHTLQQDAKEKRGLRWFYVVVDALLLLAVAAGALLVYAIWAPTPEEGLLGEARHVQYTLEVSDIREEFLPYAQEKMTVFAFGAGESIGTVQEVAVSDREGKRVLVLTLRAEARYLEGRGYYIGDFRVASGNGLEIMFENVYGRAQCVGVTVEE